MRLSSLSQFKSVLIHGPYHPSAPIHLSLSVPPPHHAILITPSRDSLLQALQNHSDEWLNTHSTTGSVASMSSRVTVFYPPSPKHLVAVLAMLRTHDVSSPTVPVDPKVTLDRAPTLLVLHEPSAYFLSGQGEHTVSSYLLLITHALSTIEYLSLQSWMYVISPLLRGCTHRRSSSPTSLVVFDTQLDHLKLPILRTPPRSAFDERDEAEDAPRPESVLFFAEKYFELSGTLLHGQAELDPQISVFALDGIGKNLIEKKSRENICCSVVD